MLRWSPRWLPASRMRPIRNYAALRLASNKTNARSPPSSNDQSSPTPTSKRPRHSLSPTVRYLVYAAAFSLGVHVFFGYFYSADSTWGISMLPTLASFGDWVIISKYYRRGRGVNVGDVVSFKNPVRVGEDAIKRVVGLEGDFVLMNTPEKSDAMIQIPQGHCWVVGDNLKHSRDSRTFGPLPMALINGKVIARYNSKWDFSWIENGLESASVDDELD